MYHHLNYCQVSCDQWTFLLFPYFTGHFHSELQTSKTSVLHKSTLLVYILHTLGLSGRCFMHLLLLVFATSCICVFIRLWVISHNIYDNEYSEMLHLKQTIRLTILYNSPRSLSCTFYTNLQQHQHTQHLWELSDGEMKFVLTPPILTANIFYENLQ